MNICTELLGNMIIDDKYALEGMEGSNTFYLIPLGKEFISHDLTAFYADCIAFEHHSPTVAVPSNTTLAPSDVPWLLIPSTRRKNKLVEAYIDSISTAYQEAVYSSFGVFAEIVFKYDIIDALTNLPTQEYKGQKVAKIEYKKLETVAQQLHLYNTAMKQPDPLEQYLNYYRILESFDGSNGKPLIERMLRRRSWGTLYPVYAFSRATDRRLMMYDAKSFTPIRRLAHPKDRVDIGWILYNEARLQIRHLKKRNTVHQIAKRLYGNRNSIAHGNQIKRHDIGADYVQILHDLKIVRFFARMSIEDAI